MIKHLPSTLAILLLSACTIAPPSSPAPVSPAAEPSSASAAPAGEQDEPVETSGTGSNTLAERMLPTGTIELGDANAPIGIIVFTNYYCSYCQDFQDDILPRLATEYIHTGRARLTVIPYLLKKYPQSEQAALTFLCALEQGKGMDMHDLLFKERMNTAAYRTALTEMEIDQAQLKTCLENGATKATLGSLQSYAHALDVRVVPTYFINGEKHVGLPEYADLRGEIEEMKNVE